MTATLSKNSPVKERNGIRQPAMARPVQIGLLLTFGMSILFGILEKYTPANPKAPASTASLARAVRDIDNIAQSPHPVGTSAELRVGAYLTSQLKDAGLQPELQASWYVERLRNREYSVVQVRNILTRLPGVSLGPAKAVLFTAHYDSAAGSFGAADDGAGVAALLETARLLNADPRRLKRDVWFLFTDGEEQGLSGAKAFLKSRPDLRNEVAVVINFDARGESGPAIMFQTGSTGDALVPMFLENVSNPYTTSLASTVYRILPNTTDFSAFRNAGLPGLNFAFLDDWPGYHSAMDSSGRLSKTSLQHFLEYATSLAHSLGDADSLPQTSPQLVYFNLAGNHTVHYSAEWGTRTCYFALFGSVLIVGASLKGRFVKAGGLLAGFGSAVVAALISPVLSTLILLALFSLNSATLFWSGAYAVVTVLLASAVSLFVARYAMRRFGPLSVTMGGLMVWLLIAFWANHRAPGTTYLVVWPLLAALLCCAVIVSASQRRLPTISAAAALLLCPIAPLILTPMLKMVGSALVGTGVAAISIPTSLGIFVMLPWVALVQKQIAWPVPTFLAGLALLISGGLAAGVRYDGQNRQSDSVFYVEDANQKTATWNLAARTDDTWTSRLPRTGTPPRRNLPDWFSAGMSFPKVLSAPFFPLPQPTLSNVQSRDGITRFLVKSPGQGPVLAIHLSADSPLRNVTVHGQPIPSGQDTELTILHFGAAGSGIPIQLASGKDANVAVAERYYDLPGEARLAPRPAWLMAHRNVGDGVVVVRTFGLLAGLM